MDCQKLKKKNREIAKTNFALPAELEFQKEGPLGGPQGPRGLGVIFGILGRLPMSPGAHMGEKYFKNRLQKWLNTLKKITKVNNFGGLVLLCIDSYDSEQRRILQHFSRSTIFAFFSRP